MFTEQDYPCICHVCGKLHTVKSEFLSGAVHVMPDGTRRVIIQCGEHTSKEVRHAWENLDKLEVKA